MRRLLLAAALLLIVGAVVYLRSPNRSSSEVAARSDPPQRAVAPATATASFPAGVPPSSSQRSGDASTTTFDPADFPIAARLNDPGSSIAQDLDLVRQLFEAWQSNFPHDGNPVGENFEITAALMGENRLGLALVPRGHRALNERGELCDRWGTPFRFHQLSGTRMEIRSAGPDRTFATEDDAIWTPP